MTLFYDENGELPVNLRNPWSFIETNEEFEQELKQNEYYGTMYYVEESETLYYCDESRVICSITEVLPRQIRVAVMCCLLSCGEYNLRQSVDFYTAMNLTLTAIVN